MKTLVISTLAAVMAASSLIAVPNVALADQSHHHHHHNNTGAAIAGGVAAGVIGGLLAGSGVNNEPRYVEREPRCWAEDRPVQNAYDDGYHYERVRVCN
ncbi:hypothetical protein [Rhizobium sp. RAF56]|uniref:hypothetical protein n=1 Tax=Rhizobium sp. RAF56 TaxID=3233062 RepID=UPI003F9931CD